MQPKFRAMWGNLDIAAKELKHFWVICLILLNMQCVSATSRSESESSSDVHGWPGYMKPLGTEIPKKNVDVYKKFPPVEVFFSDFVLPRIPVRMKKASKGLSKIFNGQVMAFAPQAFTTYIDVSKEGESEVKKMSVRNFLNNYKKENLLLDIPIPTIIKSQIALPRCLQCKAVADELLSTNLLFLPEKRAHPLKSNGNHFIGCQFRGKSHVYLINFASFPKSKEVLDVKDGLESGVNVEAVDYEKYPALREVKEYYIATLEKGDCLYVPAKWLYQWTSFEESLLLSITWRSKLIVPSVASCDNMSETDLVALNFLEDPEPDLLSFFTFNNLHHFIQNYYLEGLKRKLTFEVFEEFLKKEEKTIKDLEWNDECEIIAKEMFQQLDVNHDDILSVEDLDKLSFEDTNHLAGLIDDRLADFEDIDEDQKAEKKGSLLDVSKNIAANYEDLQNTFQNSLGDLLKQMEEIEKQVQTKKQENKVEETKSAQEEETSNDDSKDVEEIQADNDDDEMAKIKMMEKMIRDAVSGKTGNGEQSKTGGTNLNNADRLNINIQNDDGFKKDEL